LTKSFVSQHTREECLVAAFAEKSMSSPMGLTQLISMSPNQGEVRQRQKGGRSVEGKNSLTVGRLVPAKVWRGFVEEVMPRLDRSYLYLAGRGLTRPDYLFVKSLSLAGPGFHWKVTEDTRNKLFRLQTFIMLIEVDGDVKGSVRGDRGRVLRTPVIARCAGSRRGSMEEPVFSLKRKCGKVSDRVYRTDLDRQAVRSLVIETYNWSRIYQRYRDILMGH
jgi:hypothetical protein